jgi:hypothetical protein
MAHRDPLTKPLVYLAGPYGLDPVGHTRAAITDAMVLWHGGQIAVVIPHLTLLADLVTPMPAEAWYRFDHDLLAHCDALLRWPGKSAGADGEVALANQWGIPVFYSPGELLTWATTR